MGNSIRVTMTGASLTLISVIPTVSSRHFVLAFGHRGSSLRHKHYLPSYYTSVLYDPVLLPEKSSPNFLESYFFKSLDLSVPLFMHVTLALLTDGQSPGEAQQEQRGWVFPDLHFTFSYRNDMNPVMGAKGQKISQLSPQIVVVEQRATRVSAWGTSDTHHTGRDPGFEPA
ncbi:hypothetical protein PtrSN002B_001009 [Pyrenophora tritici-repentis]|nr:hypothetical protein PtrV1_03611 [Pyrenophora tritici-repentis]KAG9385649.1 hypothetical protein A1F94_002399 [Pyrenophora tritici-repentis]KAI0592243.1 hypothetical protein Alg130_00530 [Pyrenophora tritici-repentis]KAI0615363.1 hypothetical protein TUN205_00451 [Pyrenophora tritici-repentis]KAI1546690.1 hypothetical protein PtrSN001C_002734 [Pyrenophora tritici-repentis]